MNDAMEFELQCEADSYADYHSELYAAEIASMADEGDHADADGEWMGDQV